MYTGTSVTPDRPRKNEGFGFLPCCPACFDMRRGPECNHCVPPRPGGSCITTEEECGYNKDACISAKFLTKPFSHFRRCIKMTDCELLQLNGFINTHCCNTDNCN
ncbi:hypothetical protein AGOR_G00042120 [Albula goreensis]|uniref:Uncharacterized protein n=1 Tax=Albula goreensis TaxID=1534307 RepID=A0A8T3E5P9_9TELE|nr:hypothetical protein AGOR_G00042120 [Albula goreensis]